MAALGSEAPPMDGFTIIGPDGAVIDSVDAWFRSAPPKKGAAHWVEGRSAKELAKAWFRTGRAAAPDELLALLGSAAISKGAAITIALPEHRTAFDTYPGGKRQHDLFLQLRDETNNTIVVGIEAKVSETLDARVIEKLDEARAKFDIGESTNLAARVEELLLAILGRSIADDVKLGQLRYQLLTATAGLLVEAASRQAHAAILVVHDLSSTGRAHDVFTPTQLDVSDFTFALGATELLRAGRMAGPFKIPGGGRIPSNIPLYVGLAEAVARK